MGNSYHDKVLKTFCEKIGNFTDILEFEPSKIKKKYEIKFTWRNRYTSLW